MNIRNLSNPVTSVEVGKATPKKDVKASESHEDRDADGRQQHADADQSPLNEEEMKKAKEYFANLESLKKSGLKFEIDDKEDVRIFLILAPDGSIVRRIPEHEVRQLLQDKGPNTGQIFSRAGSSKFC